MAFEFDSSTPFSYTALIIVDFLIWFSRGSIFIRGDNDNLAESANTSWMLLFNLTSSESLLWNLGVSAEHSDSSFKWIGLFASVMILLRRALAELIRF